MMSSVYKLGIKIVFTNVLYVNYLTVKLYRFQFNLLIQDVVQ